MSHLPTWMMNSAIRYGLNTLCNEMLKQNSLPSAYKSIQRNKMVESVVICSTLSWEMLPLLKKVKNYR